MVYIHHRQENWGLEINNFTDFMLKTTLGRFRLLAFIEGVSFLLILFVTMPLKYFFQMPEPNKVIGMAHGLLFVLYVVMAFQAKSDCGWSWRKTGLILLASIIPFGTFYADKKWLQN